MLQLGVDLREQLLKQVKTPVDVANRVGPAPGSAGRFAFALRMKAEHQFPDLSFQAGKRVQVGANYQLIAKPVLNSAARSLAHGLQFRVRQLGKPAHGHGRESASRGLQR